MLSCWSKRDILPLEAISKRSKRRSGSCGTSINSFIATALAEKLSAFLTKEYLEMRADRSSEEKFQQALSEVPDIEPAEYDCL